MKSLLPINRIQKSALLGLFLFGLLLPNAFSAAPLPPVIAEQPESQSVEAGGTATFQVVVTSGASVSYQWRKDGVDIVGATDSSYTIASVQPSDAADYSVEVSNVHGGTTSVGATLTVVVLNAAPVLDVSKSPALLAVNQGAGAPVGAVGTLVSALVDSSIPTGQLDNVIDSDAGTLLGIAVTAADTSNGAWFYSIDNGTSWNALGAVSSANARLLAADASTRLYFQPTAGYNGTLANAITFRAWDQTSGTNGGTAALTGTHTLRDEFSAVAYTNNDGTSNWKGDWVEANDDGIATHVDYRSNIYIEDGKLRVDNLDGGAFSSITRAADLSAATTATLTLDYDGIREGGVGGDRFTVKVSDDGGATWTLLEEITVPGDTSANLPFSGSLSYPLESVVTLTSDMVIRLSISAGFGGTDQHVNFDNVQIQYLNDGGGTSAFSTATDTASLTVTPLPPTIIEHPQSQSVEAGGTVSFAVVASSLSQLSYQWRKNGVNIAGATSSTYTIQDAQPGDVADYSVEVSNPHGSTTSDNATLTLANAAPVAIDDSYSVQENSTLVVAPPAANLANWWKFDDGETSQKVVDLGALGNDGTRGSSSEVDASDPTWISGYVGTAALSFDGADDYVSTPSTVVKTASAFALSVWFKTDKTTGQQHILWAGNSGGNGYGGPNSPGPGTCEMNLSVGNWDQDHKIVLFLGYDVPANGADPISIVSASDFTDTDRWHHAAVTVTDLGDGTFSAALYVDGVLEGTDTGVENDRTQWGSLRIGRPGASQRHFQGQVDEVRIYDAVLSAAQIQGILQAGVLWNDADEDSRPIAVNTNVISAPTNGTLIMDSDGSFAYTPDPGFVGTDTFSYKASDGLSDSSPANVTITVTPIPPPVLSTAASSGVTAEGFSFELSASVGTTYVIEASSNFQDWMPIATNVAASASVVFTDPAAANFPSRFYRAVLQ